MISTNFIKGTGLKKIPNRGSSKLKLPSERKDFIAAMRTLWRDEEAEYKGKYSEFTPVRCYPKPKAPNGPPVLVGGIGSPYVYRRVAEWGDGWIPLIADMAAFEEGMEKLNIACEGVGRDMATVDVTIFGMSGQWRRGDEIRQLEKGGANRVVIWINAQDSEGAIREMEALAIVKASVSPES